MLRSVVAASLAIVMVEVRSAEAQCGAFCLYEVGSPDNFMSAAGASARAQDAATALFNIAGTTRLDGVQIMASTVAGFADQEFKVSSTTPANAGNSGGPLDNFATLGALFVSGQVYETPLRLAASISGLYGGSLDYDNDWAARTLVTETSLIGLNLAPGIAYRVLGNENSSGQRLSIGGALNTLFLKADYQRKAQFTETLTSLSPTLEVDDAKDWAFGGTIALLYEIGASTRIGLNYRTPVEVNLSGDLDQPGAGKNFRFDSTFELAQGLNMGAFHAFTPEWAVLADAGWSDWSRFDYQAITVNQARIPNMERNFHDTWRIGAGVQYTRGAKSETEGRDWRFSGGFSYDSSPVDADDRFPDLPASEQYRFSAGVEKFAGENIRLGLGYTFLWAANNEIDGVQFAGDSDAQGNPLNYVTLSGEYDPSFAHYIFFNVEVRLGGCKSNT